MFRRKKNKEKEEKVAERLESGVEISFDNDGGSEAETKEGDFTSLRGQNGADEAGTDEAGTDEEKADEEKADEEKADEAKAEAEREATSEAAAAGSDGKSSASRSEETASKVLEAGREAILAQFDRWSEETAVIEASRLGVREALEGMLDLIAGVPKTEGLARRQWKSGLQYLFGIIVNGYNYADDMERTSRESEIKGRNEAIYEMRRQEQDSDGVPHPSSGYIGNMRRESSIFDLAASCR